MMGTTTSTMPRSLLMHTRTGGLAAILLATLSVAIAAPVLAQDASTGPDPSGGPAASTSVAGSPSPLQPGTARIRTGGMVDAEMVLPIQPGMTTITDSAAEIRFQDATLDTLNISLTLDSRGVSDSFVGVGVPGTSIFEAGYFADFLHTQCVTTVTTLEMTRIAGTITCADLGNGDDSGTITLDAAFDTGVIGATAPSAS
jgi:hypothetical protein